MIVRVFPMLSKTPKSFQRAQEASNGKRFEYEGLQFQPYPSLINPCYFVHKDLSPLPALFIATLRENFFDIKETFSPSLKIQKGVYNEGAALCTVWLHSTPTIYTTSRDYSAAVALHKKVRAGKLVPSATLSATALVLHIRQSQ